MADDVDLEAIRARLAAIDARTSAWGAEYAIDTSSLQSEREARPIWYVYCGEEEDGNPVFVANHVVDRATAEFIAAAPTDMRMLLDLVDKFRNA